MAKDFYDKVAEKFGGYSSGVHSEKEFFGEAPEDVFKAKLTGVSGKTKVALDVGFADGRFTLEMAPHFREIVAIDLSRGMLASAQKLQQEKGMKNVRFERKDAFKTGFPDENFDVIYCRRGPTNYSEFKRLLKKGGHYVEIEIGEKDARGLKEVFGRGQDFGGWNVSRLRKIITELEKLNFTLLFAEEHLYNEYYANYKDLETSLQGVPIFEDFDPVVDESLLGKYASENTTEKGIKLERHRIVILAMKPLK